MTRRPLLDAAGAAAYLGTTERHIRDLIARREVRFVKIGRLNRFDPDDLDEYRDANTVEAQP